MLITIAAFFACPFYAELYRKNGDILLTTKAYNARCIQHWLTACVTDAAQRQHYVNQDFRLPAQALAMLLSRE